MYTTDKEMDEWTMKRSNRLAGVKLIHERIDCTLYRVENQESAVDLVMSSDS